jgi:hypothetical protein
MAKLPRSMLGPINVEMGGNSDPTGSSGGGGSNLTITNNIDGYLLKATGDANRVEGISALQYTGTALSASTNLYVSGSNNYLYVHGSDAQGNIKRFKVNIQGGILMLDSEDGG